jgi:hypothetical protein
MTAATVTLAKRIARTASPRIRPISVNDDEEWFVMFVPSLPFRDLMQDPVIINAMQYAWDRGRDNPLFTAGDILYNGVIIREIPELPVVADVGAGDESIDAKYDGYNLVEQWTSYGWNVFTVADGNNYEQVVAALKTMEHVNWRMAKEVKPPKPVKREPWLI